MFGCSLVRKADLTVLDILPKVILDLPLDWDLLDDWHLFFFMMMGLGGHISASFGHLRRNLFNIDNQLLRLYH